jgi:hypothetical protein
MGEFSYSREADTEFANSNWFEPAAEMWDWWRWGWFCNWLCAVKEVGLSGFASCIAL